MRTPPLNTTLNPTQLRLVVALAVTLVCVPLLVLDQVGGGGASDRSVVQTGTPEPSLVVAVGADVPTTEATTSTTEAPATTVAPATTATSRAPSTTSTTRARTTTTAAPKVVAAPTTTTTPAPAPPPPPPTASGGGPSAWEASFLACVRHRESRGVYSAVDPTGQFMGAYQIYQGGWNAVAASIGRSDLVGVPPHRAAPADQDAVALAMLRQYGTSPWGGSCG